MSLTILLILSSIAAIVGIIINSLAGSMYPVNMPAKIFAILLSAAGIAGVLIWLRRFLF